ncbi:hypothetical protein IHQ56_02790 [Methylobacillus flagellatus]|uniref:DUF4376 domain-containing protein n=1 Tax=Methylobacillus flagellatus TaxID=405 RepID=UPI002853DA96|nr:hypothetical protein [Methylobacillus flagellatus]MDR5170737.1 hypothetical protein [Methylobacillus flagellatus]
MTTKNRWAICNDGLPQYTVAITNPDIYFEGALIGDGICHAIPVDTSEGELLQNYYRAGDAWKVKPLCPGGDYRFNVAEEVWVFDIEKGRLRKSAEISRACRDEILNGFRSAALGSEHHYPAEPTDQINLSGTVQRSSLPGVIDEDVFPFLCEKQGVWLFRDHSAAQIQQVGRDGYAAILAARQKNAALQLEIEAATDQASLDEIAW